MFEFLKIKTLLNNLNIPANTVFRGHFKTFQYDSNNIKDPFERQEFIRFINNYKRHPQHLKFEFDITTLTIKVKHSNETSKKILENQRLLGKTPTSDPNYENIQKGFERTYDCNNSSDMSDLTHFIFGLNVNKGKNNQTILDFEAVQFQDLNLMDQFPVLTQSLIIQAEPLNIITPNGNNIRDDSIIKGHCLAYKNKINLSNYRKTQSEQLILSQESRLPIVCQNQHKEIATKMDFIKPLLGSTSSFMAKFIS